MVVSRQVWEQIYDSFDAKMIPASDKKYEINGPFYDILKLKPNRSIRMKADAYLIYRSISEN